MNGNCHKGENTLFKDKQTDWVIEILKTQKQFSKNLFVII